MLRRAVELLRAARGRIARRAAVPRGAGADPARAGRRAGGGRAAPHDARPLAARSVMLVRGAGEPVAPPGSPALRRQLIRALDRLAELLPATGAARPIAEPILRRAVELREALAAEGPRRARRPRRDRRGAGPPGPCCWPARGDLAAAPPRPSRRPPTRRARPARWRRSYLTRCADLAARDEIALIRGPRQGGARLRRPGARSPPPRRRGRRRPGRALLPRLVPHHRTGRRAPRPVRGHPDRPGHPRARPRLVGRLGHPGRRPVPRRLARATPSPRSSTPPSSTAATCCTTASSWRWPTTSSTTPTAPGLLRPRRPPAPGRPPRRGGPCASAPRRPSSSASPTPAAAPPHPRARRINPKSDDVTA